MIGFLPVNWSCNVSSIRRRLTIGRKLARNGRRKRSKRTNWPRRLRRPRRPQLQPPPPPPLTWSVAYRYYLRHRATNGDGGGYFLYCPSRTSYRPNVDPRPVQFQSIRLLDNNSPLLSSPLQCFARYVYDLNTKWQSGLVSFSNEKRKTVVHRWTKCLLRVCITHST